MRKFFIVCLSFVSIGTGSVARACDLCGCYIPQLETVPRTSVDAVSGLPTAGASVSGRSWAAGFFGAVGEQYTYFGTVQENGGKVPNPTGQYLDSSITQLVAGYTINGRLAVQLNMPFIYREFSRPEGFEIDHGTESGIGDISLLAKFLALHFERGGEPATVTGDVKSPQMLVRDPDFTFSAVLVAGMKFPSGNTDRIKEEFDEEEIPGAPESGIHGHDLTLGTGGFDGILGGQSALRYKNWFFQTDLQFSLRGDGPYQYDFANDLSWDAGPGYYLVRRSDVIVGVQFVVSGEYKDLDWFQGEPASDTGITAVYVGPRAVASFGRVSAEVEVDLPVLLDNTAFQAVPDYRIRGGLAIHF